MTFLVKVSSKRFMSVVRLFKLGKQPKAEVVTAFEGVLELGRQNRITTEQDELFGEIIGVLFFL